jgi:histidinol-phosphate aminotransferase
VHPKLTPYNIGLADLSVDELKTLLHKENVCKLSFNENPLGPSPRAIEAMIQALYGLNRYPNSEGDMLRQRIAELEGIAPEQIILANGADEMLFMIALTFLEPEDEVIIPRLSFGTYFAATNLMGARTVVSEMCPDWGIDLEDILRRITSKTKMIFLCNPNNPTGRIIPHLELTSFLSQVPSNILVIMDEAYKEYAVSPDFSSLVGSVSSEKGLIVVRTFSKIYALAGARVGYGIGPSELIRAINSTRPPFNVNGAAQMGALASLDDFEHVKAVRSINEQGKEILYSTFEELGLDYLPSDTNFVFVDVGQDSEHIFNQLLKSGIVVRTLKGYGLETQLRVSIGKEEEMQLFADALRECLRDKDGA